MNLTWNISKPRTCSQMQLSHQHHKPVQLAIGLVSALLLMSCAGDPPAPPTLELQAAEQAINYAEQRRVAENAPLEIKEAREKLNEAQETARREDVQQEEMVEARRLAIEARLMAELAAARSEAVVAKEANEEIKENINTIKDVMQPQNGGQP